MPVALYALAIAGMAGVCLVPMRFWSLIRRIRAGSVQRESLLVRLTDLLLGASVALSVCVAWDNMPVVFRCLGQSECTANRAGALLRLAVFGFTVVVVEVLWLVRRIAISKSHAAT